MYAVADGGFRSLLEKTSKSRCAHWKRYALSLTRNDADADDVVQEAIANTLRLAPDLDTEARVHQYVQRAIRNTAFSFISRRRRTTVLAEPEKVSLEASSVLDTMLDREQTAARRRLAVVAERKLGQLRREHREVIENMIMRTPRLKLREMAEIQGIATPTVHYRLKQALQKLLELVEEEGS